MRYHKKLSKKKWHGLSTVEQMANVGSEISRAIIWKEKSKDYSELAFYRAVELFGVTMNDPKNMGRLKEIARAKEMLVDWYLGENIHKSSEEQWQKYFLQFAVASRQNK